MGQEIVTQHFNKQDFERYAARLDSEMALLRQWFAQGRFAHGVATGGYEVEAWLVDAAGRPVAINEAFLQRMNSPLVVPELASFNIEFNTTPQQMRGDALRRMHTELENIWSKARDTAQALGADVLTIGILPTVRETDLVLANMSHLTRYRALNEQILRQRKGCPIRLDIAGRQSIELSHFDVMLEAAATSFQIHLKVDPEDAVRYFNASILLSAPMVAATANSPFLFGRDLWDETRIPLFEQAVSVRAPQSGWPDRVTFGHGYVQASMFECYEENLLRYPVLLPEQLDSATDELAHVRLHNGTIWRWNRPLIGFEADGTPHLRIEHRVIPSGPSNIDMIANAAFYFGLAYQLATREAAPEDELGFDQARANFYAAAKNGLQSQLVWLGGVAVPVQQLLLEELIPLARRGLAAQGFDGDDIERYMGIIEARVRSWCNGAAWQRGWVERHGPDMASLTRAYSERQHAGAPVHEWEF
jgi:gamma-glutamyl:cysteine ligase YbdK (ATP-grasp superfamily)